MSGPLASRGESLVRRTRAEDIPAIRRISRAVYPWDPWKESEIASHLDVFPEGQLVAVREGEVVGMAASLVVAWDDYELHHGWKDLTAGGRFTNHDPAGRTLYGAEVMVDPATQGLGMGSSGCRGSGRGRGSSDTPGSRPSGAPRSTCIG